MQTIRKKWNGKAVQDDGCYMSKEGKSFVTAFRNMLKRELPGTEVTIRAGHYDLSGFVQKGDKIIYVSYSIPRYGRCIDFDRSGCMEGVLYRTAKHLKDYTGGPNNFCSISTLPDSINRLFDRM